MADKNQKTTSSLAAAVSRINQQEHQELGQHNAPSTIRSSNNAGGATVTSSLSSSSMKPPARVANKSEEAGFRSHHHHKKQQRQQRQQKEQQQVTTHPGQKEQSQIKSSLARALEKEEEKKTKNKEKGHEVSSTRDSDKKHTNTNHGTTGISTTHATTSTNRREVGKEAGKVSKNKSNDNNSTTNTTRSGRRTQNTYRYSSRGGNDNVQNDGNSPRFQSNHHNMTRHQIQHATNKDIPRSSSSSGSTVTSNKSRTRNTVQNGQDPNGNASNRPNDNSVGRSRLPMRHDHHFGESGHGKSDLKQFTKQMDNLHVTTSKKGYKQRQQHPPPPPPPLVSLSSSVVVEQEQKVSLQHDNQIHNDMLKPRLVSKSEVPVGNFDSSQIVLNWADDSSDDDDDDYV